MKKKPIWKSKTLWVNVAIFIIAIAPSLADMPNLQIPKEYLAVIVLVANTILRFMTDSPVSVTGKK